MGCSQSRPTQRLPAPVDVNSSGTAGGQPGTIPRVKLVLLGDSGVGKSCLVLRYVRGQFDKNSKVTVGASFMSHNVQLPDGSTYKFEIWDTAGQERYASLAPLYYRGAAAALIVFDITQEETFEKAKYWVTELQKNTTGDLVLVLVGNKSDLVEQRKVQADDALQYAESMGMSMYIETSAKTAANVSHVFETVAAQIQQRLQAQA